MADVRRAQRDRGTQPYTKQGLVAKVKALRVRGKGLLDSIATGRYDRSSMLESNVVTPISATIQPLSEPLLQSEPRRDAQHTSLASVALIVVSTLIGAAAQILLRFGADKLGDAGLAGLLTNFPLIGGYACLAVNTLLVVIALRGGQLSVLYPIIALTYVWVTILAPIYFHDAINASKVIGLALIIAGVSFIGSGSGK